MRNLLSNGLKFTPAGGHVVLSFARENGFWHTSVRDNGMAAERTARLFNRDNEYLSTLGTANERGLGLGLQLCHDFVVINKGTISVRSAEGEGATFTFVLPTTGPVLSRKSA